MYTIHRLAGQYLSSSTRSTCRNAHFNTVKPPRLLSKARPFSSTFSNMAVAAVGQICSTSNMAHNLDQCLTLVKEAAQAGAKAIFFPEASDYIASSPKESLSLARPESESPFVLGLQAAAREHGIHIHVGIHVPVPATAEAAAAAAQEDGAQDPTATNTTTKLLNRTIWILPTGQVDAWRSYDKLHLFDYGSLRESAHTLPGPSLVAPFDTPVGRVGSLICFDLRFPEAALALGQPRRGGSGGGSPPWRPAQVLTFPSAFTVPTGATHWEPLLRARAIEAQCWVVAAGAGRVSYGGSMVVDPWGRVRCALPAVEEREDGDMSVPDGAVGALGLVDIDLGQWESVRERMPLARRTDVFPEI